ncbi:MAG: M23 family metallopeptidase [Gemmatimonadaceae bacterium]
MKYYVLAAAATLLACSGSTTSNGEGNNPYGITATGPGVLSVSPLDTSDIDAVTPLGYLAPPGHVLPTDHVYLMFVDPWNGQQQNADCRQRPVLAAGSGVVTFTLVTESAGDTKVDIQMTRTFHYYYDHVLLRSGISVGSHVQAGDTIATTTGRCPSIDLGVYDADQTPSGFVNPDRYGESTGHAVSPYKYFSEPLRSAMYRRVRLFEGVPADKDGRVDWGVKGRLSGDWFHQSLASASAGTVMGPTGWPLTLSFARDWFDGTPRISLGGTIADPGVLRPAPTDPDPVNVSVASGFVAFRGTPVLGRIAAGWVAAQMQSDNILRIEFFPGSGPAPTAFTSAAQLYVR